MRIYKVQTKILGRSRPTKHHPIIPEADIIKINEYLNINNPVALRFKIWYLLATHFVSRGCEFHPQLMILSLKFEKDENDKEYLIITHETQQKNHQGGLNAKTEETQDKRMYEIRHLQLSNKDNHILSVKV